ncbi:hypothetical protein [Mucilaginibacter phyllosphaerae]
MTRRQYMINLINEYLSANDDAEYIPIGPDVVMDNNLISINFTLKSKLGSGNITVRGSIDEPLNLRAQYDHRYELADNKAVHRMVDEHLKAVSEWVNSQI